MAERVFTKSKDGIERTTIGLTIRLTRDELKKAEAAHTEFAGESTFSGWLSILLKRNLEYEVDPDVNCANCGFAYSRSLLCTGGRCEDCCSEFCEDHV